MKPEHILALYTPNYGAQKYECRVYANIGTMMNDENVLLIQREMAETNPMFRQVIPYVTLRSRDGRVLVYRRLKGVGEARLAGKSSIGVGGHVDGIHCVYDENKAISLWDSVRAAMIRELKEEFGVDASSRKAELLGFILDDSDPVGQVHVGVLIAVEIEDIDSVRSQEAELELVGWKFPHEIDRDTLEKWSVAAVDKFNQPDVEGKEVIQ